MLVFADLCKNKSGVFLKIVNNCLLFIKNICDIY